MNKAYRLLLTTVNIILYLVIIGLWIAIPEEMILNISVSAINLVLSLVILVLFRRHFMNFYRSSFFKNFSSTIISAVLILMILGLVNYLFYVNPKQLDVTGQNWNSLSKESVQILKRTPGKLTFHIFGKQMQERPIRSFLERYRVEKNDLEILFHDVQLRPDLVNSFKITRNGVIVVEYKSRKEEVAGINELEMAKTLARLSRNEDPLVYYLSGLNNLDLADSQGQGGLILKRSLIDSAYKVETVDVHSLGAIPTNVKAVMLWGPKMDLTQQQIAVLDKYLKQGGTLITALDPDLNGNALPLYRNFLKGKGIEIANNLVVDNHSFVNGSDGIVPLIQKNHSTHEIVQAVPMPIFFPLTSSVRSVAGQEGAGMAFTTLVETSIFPHSWAENTPRDYAQKKHEFDKGEDYPGPVSIAGALENKRENWRIVAFGTSSFIHNSYGSFTNNFRMFMNSLSWLVEKDNNIILNLPVFKEEPVFISSPQLGVIFYFSVVFIPLLLCGGAIYSYRRRQKL